MKYSLQSSSLVLSEGIFLFYRQTTTKVSSFLQIQQISVCIEQASSPMPVGFYFCNQKHLFFILQHVVCIIKVTRIISRVVKYFLTIARSNSKFHSKIATSNCYLLVEKRTILALWLSSYFFRNKTFLYFQIDS